MCNIILASDDYSLESLVLLLPLVRAEQAKKPNNMTKKEHDAVTYKIFWPNVFPWRNKGFPENLVSANPVCVFGILIGMKMTLAKKNYPWTYNS